MKIILDLDTYFTIAQVAWDKKKKLEKNKYLRAIRKLKIRNNGRLV